MLKSRFKPAITFGGIIVFYGLTSFINMNRGLYLVFPQELLFLLSSLCKILILFRGKTGKKVMIAIFMDGLGYLSNFIFLPMTIYISVFFLDNSFLYDWWYRLCDILTLLSYGIFLEWMGRNYPNLQGNTSMKENLYLLILSFFARQSVIYYGTSQFDSNRALISSLSVTLAALGGIALLIFSFYYVDRKLVLALAKQKNAFLENQITVWKEEDKQLAGFRHDFKNHMICLKNLLRDGKTEQAERYLNNLTHSASLTFADVSTGNIYADAILREKLLLAETKGIHLETDLIFPPSEMLPPMDLCIILSNALDNALEACEKSSFKDSKPVIRAISYVRHYCLFLEITNPLPSLPEKSGEFFKSTKNDSSFHGMGLSNIKKAVDHCHGTLQLSVLGECFQFFIMLPLTPAGTPAETNSDVSLPFTSS